MALKINYEIVGDKTINDYFLSHTFTLAGKVERKIDSLVDTDGAISIPIDKLGTISYIVAYSLNAVITITAGGVSTELNVKGLLVYDIDETYAGTITAITVETASTEAVDVEIKVYGE